MEVRYKDHIAGKACRTTKFDPPLKLVYSESFLTFSEARKREAQIKRWTRAKKEALVAGKMDKLVLTKDYWQKILGPDIFNKS